MNISPIQLSGPLSLGSSIASPSIGAPSISTPSVSTPSVGTSAESGPAGAGQVIDGFGQALMDAIGSLNSLQQGGADAGMKLAAGEPIELHDVMLAQDRASLGFQLAVQVRNKMVEAYQDVMRMQI